MAFAGTYTINAETEDLRSRVARLDRLSRLLDIAFVVPGTQIRFGLDAIIGLVPIIGDWAGIALSSIIVIEAMKIGVPKPLVARMIGNVVVEGVVGSVPILGDVFDVYWRANRRNIELLMDYLRSAGKL